MREARCTAELEDLASLPWQEQLKHLITTPEQAVLDAWGCAPRPDLCNTLRWVDIRLKGMQHIAPRRSAWPRR